MEIFETKNKRLRREKWVGIIIHHTTVGDNPTESKWKQWAINLTNYLANNKAYVSAHYTIDREGIVRMIVNPITHEAWHAGVSSYYHPVKQRLEDNWNRYAIGIELIGDGNKYSYTYAQYKSLAGQIKELMRMFPTIKAECILGHEHIAPNRKIDPGKLFDWSMLYSLIFSDESQKCLVRLENKPQPLTLVRQNLDWFDLKKNDL